MTIANRINYLLLFFLHYTRVGLYLLIVPLLPFKGIKDATPATVLNDLYGLNPDEILVVFQLERNC